MIKLSLFKNCFPRTPSLSAYSWNLACLVVTFMTFTQTSLLVALPFFKLWACYIPTFFIFHTLMFKSKLFPSFLPALFYTLGFINLSNFVDLHFEQLVFLAYAFKRSRVTSIFMHIFAPSSNMNKFAWCKFVV
jgi:hypothetical protein